MLLPLQFSRSVSFCVGPKECQGIGRVNKVGVVFVAYGVCANPLKKACAMELLCECEIEPRRPFLLGIGIRIPKLDTDKQDKMNSEGIFHWTFDE